MSPFLEPPYFEIVLSENKKSQMQYGTGMNLMPVNALQ